MNTTRIACGFWTYCLLFLIGLLWIGPNLALAGHAQLPEGGASNTHQRWDFNTDQSPLEPDSLDYSVANPYGDPIARIRSPIHTEGNCLGCHQIHGGGVSVPEFPFLVHVGVEWLDDINDSLPESDRQGAWKIWTKGREGTHDAMEFQIPNFSDDTQTEQLRFEVTLWTKNPDDAGGLYVKLFDDRGSERPFSSRIFEPIGDPVSGARWLRATYTFDMDTRPAFERIVLGAALRPGEMIVLDQVDIDTYCIPEPGSLSIAIGQAVLGLPDSLSTANRVSRQRLKDDITPGAGL